MPLSRPGPKTVDVAIGAVVAGINVVELSVAGTLSGVEVAVASPTSLLLGAAVALRQVLPVGSVALFVVAYALQARIVGHVDVITIVASWVALVASAAIHLPLRRALVAGVLGFLPILVFLDARPDRSAVDVGPGELALAVIPWVAGRLVRASRDQAASAREQVAVSERRREEAAERAALEERARIARDLHDIVAHALTTIVVQAEAGEVWLTRDRTRAGEALQAIQRSGRDALHEMRTLLSVLRDESAGTTSAVPTLAALEQIVTESPLAVQLHIRGNTMLVPATVQVGIYRIVQEALTNVAKHSGAGRASVEIDVDAAAVAIAIADPGPSRVPVAPPGFGLVGIRERIHGLGGSVDTGADGDGYVVRAHIPIGAV